MAVRASNLDNKVLRGGNTFEKSITEPYGSKAAASSDGTRSQAPRVERRATTTAAATAHLLNVGRIAPKVQEKMLQKAQLAKLQVLLADDPQTMELVQTLMLPKEERTITQLTDLRDLMRTTAMLREVADDVVQQLEICRHMSLEIFSAKDRIIKEGEVGDRAYVLIRGSIAIYTGRIRESMKPVDILKPVCSFGEIALKADVPRNATCMANDDGVICATMPRLQYRRYVQSGERREVLRFYQNVFSKSFADQDLISLAFSSDVKFAHRGAILTQAGKTGPRFFFLKQGLCNVVNHNKEQELEAARLVSAPPSESYPEEPSVSSPTSKRTPAGGDEESEKEESFWFGGAARWMWESKHIWTTIVPGDFFGLEAAVCDGTYMNTIVAATECQIIVLSISCWPGAFPKVIREKLESSLLQTIDWRKHRQSSNEKRPQSVLDFDNQRRAIWLRGKSGRAEKFVPKRPQMQTYTVWKAPERQILRDAEVQEFPELESMRKTVSLPTRSRQFRMESSVCLQLSPLDLLRAPKKGPQMMSSVGFLHQGPKQRGPPNAVHLPSIRKNASSPQLGKEASTAQ